MIHPLTVPLCLVSDDYFNASTSPVCIAGIALRIFSSGQFHHCCYIILIGGFIHSAQVF